MAKIKHGWCGTPLYNVWKTMRQRCRNINSTDYKWYGAVGIDICDEWEDFKEFRDWSLKNGYSIGLTIDRINPSAGYSPDNCRWITIQDQQKNKKSVLHINLEGDTFTVSELCEKYGITKQMFYDRRHKGWDINRILTTPKIKTGGYREKGAYVFRG